MLAVVMLIAMLPCSLMASAEELQIEVGGSNCTRDAGKLIVYTDDYGVYTGTNQWGVEAVVSKNRVISIIKGNARIPENGFVVSGHDDEENPNGKMMKTWIKDNIQVGDYVYYNRRTSQLTVSDKPLDLGSPFYSFDNPADGVDIPRDNDKMIIYTPEFGTSTQTSEYGYEVVIENDIVTKLGGNNSVIPENGYIVSIHGAPAKWMKLKLTKGMTVEYDPETLNVVFTYSAEGLKKAVTYAIESAQGAIDAAKEAFVFADYDAAQAELDDASATYQDLLADFENGGDENDFADGCDEVIERADVLCNGLCDSYTVQYRGAWLRPSQRTAAEVETFVERLHKAGINFVCVEGWFENGVIMEIPEDSLFARHPSFNYDVLQAYIDACHKFDMECHLWMPILCVGNLADPNYETNTVTGQKPEWLSLSQHDMPYNKDGFMMIDPANDDAREYMMEFYRYIITTYDIDCFEMDYIRYYAKSHDTDFGYTEAAFAGFEKAHGYGVTPEFDPRADYWEDWCQFRRDCVTQWVRDIRDLIDEEAPDMLLAADVAFPFEHASDAVYQDFPLWLEEGLLDILHPMAYGDGYGEDICKSIELAGEKCMVVTGLGAQTDFLGAPELERQAREDNLYGAYGDCYFEANTYMSDQVPAAVKKTVYREEAITPFLDMDDAVETALNYLIDRIDQIIVPLGGMSAAEADAVKDAAEDAQDSAEDGMIGERELKALYKAITNVNNEQARDALLGDLYRAEQIACVQYGVASVVAPTTSGDASSAPLSTVLVIVIAAAAVVLVGGAAWFILRKRKNASAADAEVEEKVAAEDEPAPQEETAPEE